MTSLESASLGSTNRTVSRLGFGGAPVGLTNYLEEYSPEHAGKREQAIAAIQFAADSGITYFDTAAAYGSGESERILGEALSGRVTAPADVLLADPPSSGETSNDGRPSTSPSPSTGEGRGEGARGSTVSPSTLREAQDGNPRPSALRQAQDGSAGAHLFLATKVAPSEPDVRGSIERSLRNLRVDRIDLVQVHGGSYTAEDEYTVMKPGGVLETLEKARDEGLIRHIGFTTEDQNGAVYRFIESGRFDVIQVQYNLLFQHPYSPERPFGSILAASKAGMGIVTMRALTSGAFQRWITAVRPDDHFDYSAALLHFTLSNPLVDVALAGMRTVDEVERNIAVLNDLSGRIDLESLHRKFV